MTTLTSLRDRVEATLQDSGNSRWSTDDLDEAIRKALEEYSLLDPREAITTITLSAAGREIDISAISDRLAVKRVWWPYTSTDPEHPPNWCAFEEWADPSGSNDLLFLDTGSEPAASDVVRIWYTTLHTLDGLDGATATTLPPGAGTALVSGAAGFAAQQRAGELSETLNVDAAVVERLAAWSAAKLAEFRLLLAARARNLAARNSGQAPAPVLDRWESRSNPSTF